MVQIAWTTPITWTNAVLTAAQLNAQVKDNLLETAPAKASAISQYFVATGANSITTRAAESDVLDNILTTTSTSYTTAGDPTVTVTTGSLALVFLFGVITINTNSESCYYGFSVSGATTQTANDNRALQNGRYTVQFLFGASVSVLVTGLTAGSNSFNGAHRVTNAAATGTISSRRIAVMGF